MTTKMDRRSFLRYVAMGVGVTGLYLSGIPKALQQVTGQGLENIGTQVIAQFGDGSFAAVRYDLDDGRVLGIGGSGNVKCRLGAREHNTDRRTNDYLDIREDEVYMQRDPETGRMTFPGHFSAGWAA